MGEVIKLWESEVAKLKTKGTAVSRTGYDAVNTGKSNPFISLGLSLELQSAANLLRADPVITGTNCTHTTAVWGAKCEQLPF